MQRSFADIIGLWESADSAAADIGERPATVRKWKQRNRIPSEYWVAVVTAAQARGFAAVTLELLAQLAATGGTFANDHGGLAARGAETQAA